MPLPRTLNGHGNQPHRQMKPLSPLDPRRYGNGRANGHMLPPEYFDRVEEAYRECTPRQTNARTRYRDYFPPMVYQLRLLGASNRAIANACDVSEKDIWDWTYSERPIPEFAEAMKLGGELADARVAMSQYHRAIGYSHPDTKIVVAGGEVVEVPITKHYPPDASAGQFWLTNRQSKLWRNRTTSEITGPDGEALVPPQLVIQPVQPKG